ncbi:hypothetical protein [Actinoplanes sp. OR16]|uniref:hypothetical protein n=1 Tax=Actinoplanes sp. OR16 TaxID=946334 RepID=UPI003519EB98
MQFEGDRALLVRVARVDPKPTYDGWVWLVVFVLGPDGRAVARREIYVRVAGLRLVEAAPSELRLPRRNAGPGRSSSPVVWKGRRG